MRKKSKGPECGHFNLERGCKHCIALFDKWNDKLGPELSFDREDSSKTISLLDKDQPSDAQRANAEYYDRLTRAVESEKFVSKIDALIMERRSKGDKICEIIRALKKKRKRIHRETVRHIIRRFENKWNIRKWTNRQMNLKPRIK